MKKLLLLCCLEVTAALSFAQLPDTLKAHIDTAIGILKEHSLYAEKVDWEKAKQEAYRTASGAQNKEQLFTAIADVYRKLGDHHGMFVQYSDQLKLTDTLTPKRYSKALLNEWAKGPKIQAEMLNGMAYLRFPGMPVFNQQQIDQYANWLADSVIRLSNRNPKGWIIDLRLNTGGNITPMMAALAAFFKDGVLGYYLDKNKKPVSTAVIHNRQFYHDDTVHANLKNTLPDLSTAKVTIITGPGTASSGEGVAAFFKERKKVRLFGEVTSGYANATEGFLFNEENSYLLLTTAGLGDKKGKLLPEFVTPQVMIPLKDNFENPASDNVVEAALHWLLQQ